MLGVQTCARSEEHTSELQSHSHLVCRLLLEKKNVSYSWRAITWSNSSIPQRPCLLPAPGPSPAASTQSRCAPTRPSTRSCFIFFFFNDTATTEISSLPLQGALPF